MPSPDLTHDELLELLVYEPETGCFRWRRDRYMKKAGELAGSVTCHGYNQLCIKGRSYRAARVAWLYMTGEWPPLTVDHINRDRRDDRWANLRLATQEQNNANRGMSRRNTSGHKGVCYIKRDKKWRALWGSGRKRGGGVFLGCFDTAEEASAAYQSFVRKRFGEFAG